MCVCVEAGDESVTIKDELFGFTSAFVLIEIVAELRRRLWFSPPDIKTNCRKENVIFLFGHPTRSRRNQINTITD